ncbi:MAG: dipeptide ABC transporter ATP-binding protein [Victivallaceae bacterium]|nr:dipeptide ABC transporter ATP-binding protein [Victivallaceae bacterium]MDD3702733.1 dipeptide ABC transporter ATP-binding protein [Victivallaceae bacterium]MDD5662761.1 dipeptide ABC transporter ATP-binding protein [Victivallaceae bacterium]
MPKIPDKPMPLLEVKNLKVWYPLKAGWFSPKKYVRAVDGVSFYLEKSETLGLVGESGCGKSTLGRALVKLENPTEGSITLNEINIGSLNGGALRRARKNFQMIFQDPYGSLNPRMTIFRALDEVLKLHSNRNRVERAERVAELLGMVGMDAAQMHRYPHQFSGGQRQRIGIARALAVEPEFIIADEPVSALDVSVQAQIINLLQDIQEKTGVSFLFIAHDLAVVEHVSKRIMVMYLGKIVETGTARAICRTPLHPYTNALLSAVPAIDRNGRKRIILPGDVPSPITPPSGCPFHPRCPIATAECAQNTPELSATGSDNKHFCACFHPGKF